MVFIFDSTFYLFCSLSSCQRFLHQNYLKHPKHTVKVELAVLSAGIWGGWSITFPNLCYKAVCADTFKRISTGTRLNPLSSEGHFTFIFQSAKLCKTMLVSTWFMLSPQRSETRVIKWMFQFQSTILLQGTREKWILWVESMLAVFSGLLTMCF